MKSKALGKNISEVEIQNISKDGIWVLVKGEEFYLPYQEYPWFQNAMISQILQVQLLNPNHLYWPELDIDLELESLKNPQEYPLVYRLVPKGSDLVKKSKNFP